MAWPALSKATRPAALTTCFFMLLKDMLFLRFPLLKVCYLRFDRWHYRTTDPPECRYCPGQIPRDAVTLFGEERSKNRKKPKASGCWKKIDAMDSNFDSYPTSTHEPRAYEGTMTIGNSFFAILNTYPWEDPTAWLGPRIKKAKNQGLWTIIALHEPPITTAWYLEKRDTVLKQLTVLKPDLVFAGNQHSYERFHQIGTPKEGSIPFVLSKSGDYLKGDGTIFVVSGGGGAYFRPFADQQGFKKRTAPKAVFNTLAARALMNHFLVLKIERETLQAITYRVCPEINTENVGNPRWKAGKSVWSTITLECEGQEAGVTAFDQFQIQLKKGSTLKDKTN